MTSARSSPTNSPNDRPSKLCSLGRRSVRVPLDVKLRFHFCPPPHLPVYSLTSPSSFAADRVDVLKILDLSEDMEGVSLEAGLCVSRDGQEETDLSFKIDKKIQLSAPTKQLFPSKAEPRG